MMRPVWRPSRPANGLDGEVEVTAAKLRASATANGASATKTKLHQRPKELRQRKFCQANVGRWLSERGFLASFFWAKSSGSRAKLANPVNKPFAPLVKRLGSLMKLFLGWRRGLGEPYVYAAPGRPLKAPRCTLRHRCPSPSMPLDADSHHVYYLRQCFLWSWTYEPKRDF